MSLHRAGGDPRMRGAPGGRGRRGGSAEGREPRESGRGPRAARGSRGRLRARDRAGAGTPRSAAPAACRPGVLGPLGRGLGTPQRKRADLLGEGQGTGRHGRVRRGSGANWSLAVGPGSLELSPFQLGCVCVLWRLCCCECARLFFFFFLRLGFLPRRLLHF